MSDETLPPGDDETEAERLFHEDQVAVVDALAAVMEERGLDESELVALLIGEIYHYRAVAYVAGTPKPSESGLRLDLDRMRKDIEEIHRAYRKQAGSIVRDILAALEEMEDEADESVTPTSILSDGSGR